MLFMTGTPLVLGWGETWWESDVVSRKWGELLTFEVECWNWEFEFEKLRIWHDMLYCSSMRGNQRSSVLAILTYNNEREKKAVEEPFLLETLCIREKVKEQLHEVGPLSDLSLLWALTWAHDKWVGERMGLHFGFIYTVLGFLLKRADNFEFILCLNALPDCVGTTNIWKTWKSCGLACFQISLSYALVGKSDKSNDIHLQDKNKSWHQSLLHRKQLQECSQYRSFIFTKQVVL